MARVLVVDDDSGVSWAFSRFLSKEGHQTIAASSAEEGLDVAEREKPDIVFMDVRLPGIDGIEAVGRLKKILPTVPVVVMTGHGTLSTAVEAVKGGAFEYLLKPVSLETVRAVITRGLAVGSGREVLAEARRQLADFPPESLLIGQGPAMQEVYRQIAAAAAAENATVLLLGESGTGKELACRAIHLHSELSDGPFVAVNCAGIPETLLESELFGHARGAFTGAVAARIGRLESADGGTLFLDEVGEMSPAMQAKLLRFLESCCFERLGESQTRQVRVRVISATNRNLSDMVASGLFREDLFYRLDVLRIELPPLREKTDDIPLLLAHFLAAGDDGPARAEVDSEVLAVLERYPWPGNVREFKNCLEHGLALSRGSGVISLEHIPEHILRAVEQSPSDLGGLESAIDRLIRRLARLRIEAGNSEDSEVTPDLFEEVVRLTERAVISEVLDLLGGNQAQAARRLGVHRTTLRKKIEEYHLQGEKK
jgi:DNA-binding NtrC family response regulator